MHNLGCSVFNNSKDFMCGVTGEKLEIKYLEMFLRKKFSLV